MKKIQRNNLAENSSEDTLVSGAQASVDPITIIEASRLWTKIGLLSFGGPAAHIALMHREVVIERGWLSERQFTNALSFCMLLPGPEAMQLATYSGWRLHGVRGGLLAGGLFILPGALLILALAIGYVYFGTIAWVESLFTGLKAGISVIVLQALIKLAKRGLTNLADWLISIAGFVGIFFGNVPFPLIIAGAALYGFYASRPLNDKRPVMSLPDLRTNCLTLMQWMALWWVPIFVIDLMFDNDQLAAIGYFFSKLAVVTFGGAYAVLAYMAQDVVGHLGWLQPGTMMDGLGLAESTPGPLILVTEFVGFITAFHTGGLIYGIAGALVALWATFIPSFLWIFVGAPYIEWITHQPRLRGALAAIMAVVVGVVANLFVWFVLNILFAEIATQQYGFVSILVPDVTTVNLTIIAIIAICGGLTLWRQAGLFTILGSSGALGLIFGG
jgi:chromate transporter